MSNQTKSNILAVLMLVGFIAAVVGIRLAWAHFVYHDTRCVLAECRITK